MLSVNIILVIVQGITYIEKRNVQRMLGEIILLTMLFIPFIYILEH